MPELMTSAVTTADQSLLRAVRETLHGAEDALLCVAFVQERGVRLVEKELEQLRRRRARARLLVTTAFQRPGEAGLAVASNLGVEVRVLNPGGGTYHPKVYLGTGSGRTTAVVGSANLTGGLATNVEAGVRLSGPPTAHELVKLRDWAEGLWSDGRAERWFESMAAEAGREELAPELYAMLRKEVRRNPVFLTLGPSPKRNVVRELTKTGLYAETDRSRERGKGPQLIPAWMFNVAWDRLRTHKTLTNTELLNDILRVHRSSAVCAILGRLPVVEVASARPISLRWRGL